MSFLTYGTRDSEGNFCTCNVACMTNCGCGCKFCNKVSSPIVEPLVESEAKVEILPGEIWIDCSKSSNVTNIKYNPETKELQVKFKDGKSSGVYESVSQDDFAGLENATSKGSYLHNVIKPKYKYRKLLLVNK